MGVASMIGLLEQLISSGLTFAPLIQSWSADRDYLKQLQDAHGPDYVPTAADFAAYDARSATAEAQIDKNAAGR
jgi:hypothetical protein